MEPYNITHLVNNTECMNGIGCLFKNINDVGNGYPFLTLFFTVYILSTFAMVKAGNSFKKAITTTSFTMLLITIVSLPFGLLGSEKLLIVMITVLSVLVASGVYSMNR